MKRKPLALREHLLMTQVSGLGFSGGTAAEAQRLNGPDEVRDESTRQLGHSLNAQPMCHRRWNAELRELNDLN